MKLQIELSFIVNLSMIIHELSCSEAKVLQAAPSNHQTFKSGDWDLCVEIINTIAITAGVGKRHMFRMSKCGFFFFLRFPSKIKAGHEVTEAHINAVNLLKSNSQTRRHKSAISIFRNKIPTSQATSHKLPHTPQHRTGFTHVLIFYRLPRQLVENTEHTHMRHHISVLIWLDFVLVEE